MRSFWKRPLIGSLVMSLMGDPLFFVQAQVVGNPPDPPTPIETTIGFDPDLILNDGDIFELGSMTLTDIQAFLSEKGTLGQHRTNDIDGVEKSAAEIVWRVSTSYKINPRYLLALLQKEQSLVEHPNPSQRQFDWATGYGVCDHCSKDDPSIQDFKGFASQLEWAAKQHREKYLLQILGRGRTIAGHAPGRTILIDGQSVTPTNNATAMLYSYTPHIAGNRNLWRIWQRWYSLTFPEGAMVRGKTSEIVYLLRYGEKRPMKSAAVASSLTDPNKIVIVEDAQLSGYRLGKTISFPNFSLVSFRKNIYLLSGTKKRLIMKDAFVKFGFNEDEVVEVTEDTLSDYEDGPDITVKTTYPIGLLVKDPKGAYWYLENNVRHPVPDRAFLQLYFKQRVARSWTQKQLEAIPLGTAYQLQDGELVRSKEQPTVYVMEAGERRPFLAGSDFEELGYAWKNVITLPKNVLASYAVGKPVDPHPEEEAPLLITTSLPPSAASSTVSATVRPASTSTP